MSDYLPQELIIQILTRLPPKSLLRFRCVCKSWRALISSPDFISTHTHQHTLSTHNPRKLVRSYSTTENKEHYAVHFDNDSFDLDPESQIKFPFEGIPRYYFRIVGCCNGLLCVSDDLFGYTNTVILWNPAIRRRLDLPSPQVSLLHVSIQYMYALGFGFDSRMNDFKVVRIAYVQNHSGYSVPSMVEVCTVKGRAWRDVNSSSSPPVYCIVDYFWSQAFINGSVHWVAYDQVGGHGGRVTSLIMSFDMSNEVFGEIMLPECLIRESPINMNTDVVGELLSVIQCDRIDRVNIGKCCSIWVMKEYGVANSWCKLCNIDIGVTLGRALDVKNSGEILLGENCGVVVSYNPRTKGIRTFGIYGSRASIYVNTYRESLALLLEGDETWDGPSTDSESDPSEVEDEGEESNVERSETLIQMVTVQYLTALLTEH